MNATRGEEIGFWKLRRERSHQAVQELECLVKWYLQWATKVLRIRVQGNLR